MGGLVTCEDGREGSSEVETDVSCGLAMGVCAGRCVPCHLQASKLYELI